MAHDYHGARDRTDGAPERQQQRQPRIFPTDWLAAGRGRAERGVDHRSGPSVKLLEGGIILPAGSQHWRPIPGTTQVRQEVVIELLDGPVLPVARLIVRPGRQEKIRITKGHTERVQRMGREGGSASVHPRHTDHGCHAIVRHGVSRYSTSAGRGASPLCARIIGTPGEVLMKSMKVSTASPWRMIAIWYCDSIDEGVGIFT